MVSGSFWVGFTKAAEENPEGHYLRRTLLGNSLSSAIEAKEGYKARAFGNALGNTAVQVLKGGGLGAAGGAGLGLAAGLLSKGKLRVDGTVPAGAYAGGALGTLAGAVKGRFGAEASRIHGEHSKHKKD